MRHSGENLSMLKKALFNVDTRASEDCRPLLSVTNSLRLT